MPTCVLCGYTHHDNKIYEQHPCPKRGSWKGNPKPVKKKILNRVRETAKPVVNEVRRTVKNQLDKRTKRKGGDTQN